MGRTINSALLPKLLGCYELELHPFITKILALNPDLIINVGAGDGYYCCGLLHLGVTREMIIYEALDENRKLIEQVLSANELWGSGVAISIRGLCTIKSLAADLERKKGGVILMDAEGSEALLLDVVHLDGLKRAHILVECHDFIILGIVEALIGKMSETHDIELVCSRGRTICDAHICNDWLFRLFPDYFKMLAVEEFRPGPMRWLWMKPKHILGEKK